MLMVSILQWRNICSYWKYHLLPPVFKWINNDKNNHTYKNVMIYINRYMSIPQRKCRLQLWSILAWLTKLYLPLLLKIWIHKVIPFSYKMQGFLEYYNLCIFFPSGLAKIKLHSLVKSTYIISVSPHLACFSLNEWLSER